MTDSDVKKVYTIERTRWLVVTLAGDPYTAYKGLPPTYAYGGHIYAKRGFDHARQEAYYTEDVDVRFLTVPPEDDSRP